MTLVWPTQFSHQLLAVETCVHFSNNLMVVNLVVNMGIAICVVPSHPMGHFPWTSLGMHEVAASLDDVALSLDDVVASLDDITVSLDDVTASLGDLAIESLLLTLLGK